jgi:hypothetical protein
VPGLRLTVRSALPRERLAARIGGGFEHVAEARDFGFVMRNAVDIDLAASARRYREFHADWPQRVAAEADWLGGTGIDALLSNVAYLPLAAAAQAGIPAVALSSLNWADLFASYFGGETWAAPVHDQILAAYNTARCFLRVSPGLPMAGIERRHEIAPVVRIGRPDRARVSKILDLNESERWLLIAMGGMEFRLSVENWPQTPGLNWLVPREWQILRQDVRGFDVPGLKFTDLLASVDAVITKPGYGTFVEAACSGVPILYLEREDWPETPWFAAWLATHARAAVLRREQLAGGDFIDACTGSGRRRHPPCPRPAAPPKPRNCWCANWDWPDTAPKQLTSMAKCLECAPFPLLQD